MLRKNFMHKCSVSFVECYQCMKFGIQQENSNWYIRVFQNEYTKLLGEAGSTDPLGKRTPGHAAESAAAAPSERALWVK